MSKKVSSIAAIALAATLALPGCASKYGPQQTNVHYYPQCYRPIEALRQQESEINKTTAAGAVGGAALGAIIGLAASGGKGYGALIGAAAGAVGGGVAGNVYAKNKAEKQDAAYVQRYASMLDEDSASLDRVTAAAKVAFQCYDQELARIIADYKSGHISKVELRERYEEIRSGMSETKGHLLNQYNAIREKDAEYEKALAYDFSAANAAATTDGAKGSASAKKSKKSYTAVQAKTAKRAQKLEETKNLSARAEAKSKAKCDQIDLYLNT